MLSAHTDPDQGVRNKKFMIFMSPVRTTVPAPLCEI